MSGVERYALAREGDWRQSANCATTDPNVFFGEQADRSSTRLAKRICELCVVRDDCLEDALQDIQPYGVRAGYTARELYELSLRQGRTKQAERQDKYRQARALCDEGHSLIEIAGRIGYSSHAGVRYLLDRFDGESAGDVS